MNKTERKPSTIDRKERQTTVDHAEIMRALDTLFQSGDVVELRILDAQTAGYKNPHIESGYFDNWPKLAQAAATISKNVFGKVLRS
jgi:hypothetical protein